MIDLATHRMVALCQVPKHLPDGRCGKPLNPSTPFRWASRGLRADDGTLVVLETLRIGGTLHTSIEALQEFAERLTAAKDVPAPQQSPAQRRRDAEHAARECDRLGL
jgi:hypothetical protein